MGRYYWRCSKSCLLAPPVAVPFAEKRLQESHKVQREAGESTLQRRFLGQLALERTCNSRGFMFAYFMSCLFRTELRPGQTDFKCKGQV